MSKSSSPGSRFNDFLSTERRGETNLRNVEGNGIVRVCPDDVFEVENSSPGTTSPLNKMRQLPRTQSSFKTPPNVPQAALGPTEDSLDSTGISLGTPLDMKDPDSSSGFSSRCGSLSPVEEVPRRLARAPGLQKMADSVHAEPTNSSRSSARTPIPGVLTPKTMQTTSSSLTSQKRPNSDSIDANFSDKENCPERNSSILKKKRRLLDSIIPDDTSELLDNSTDYSEHPQPTETFGKSPNPSESLNKMLTAPEAIDSINPPPSAAEIPSGVAEASESFRNVLKYLENMENSKLQVSSDPNSSRPAVVVEENEPPDFTDYEALDPVIFPDSEPTEIPATSGPSVSATERPESPDEFEAFEIYEPDEDVDVGWNTEDDFSDGEIPVPAECTSTRSVPAPREAPGPSSPAPWVFQNNYSSSMNVNANCAQSQGIINHFSAPQPQKQSPCVWRRYPSVSTPIADYPSSSRRGRKKQRNSRSSRRGGWNFPQRVNTNRSSWSNLQNPQSDPLDPRGVFQALQNPSAPIEIPQDNREDLLALMEDSSSSSTESYSEASEAGFPFQPEPHYDEETKLNYLRSYFPKSKSKKRCGEKTHQEGLQTVEAILDIHGQLQKKPDEEVRTVIPELMKVSLMEHQKNALTWMRWRESCKPSGGMLADDMGLGKTVTTIALIMKSLEDECQQDQNDDRENPGGTLIVCPANLIPQWKQEIATRGNIPGVNIYHVHKENNIWRLRSKQVVITSYDTLANNSKTAQKILYKIHWKRVVLDEAHVIRNHKSLKSICVTQLMAQNRWALTGTPIHNVMRDIFPILRFLEMRPFNDYKHFGKWIANNDAAGTARLHCIMEAIMLRRTKVALIKAGLMPELPLKTMRDVTIVLAPEERLVYDRVMTYSRTLFIQFLHQRTEKERRMALGPDYRRNNNFNSVKLSDAQTRFLARRGAVSRHHIFTLILRLRQICCHPSLIQSMLEEEDFEEAGVDNLPARELEEANRGLMNDLAEFNGDEEIGIDGRVAAGRILTAENPLFNEDHVSSKIMAVLEKVRDIIERGEKVIIVSDWVGYLKIIGNHLDDIHGATYESYTGSTEYSEREKIVHKFNTTRDIAILLLSLRAGGQGLNLKGANHVILVDVHWNPQLEVQAQDRVYRIGQTRNVFIHKFICQDSIEERILDLQVLKLKIAESVLAGSKHEVRKLQLAEMCRLFNIGI